ncbi:MAG: SRPBCC family protein [Bacteroidia bacterium]
MKKFLNYTSITILVIVIIFFSIGIIFPSISFESKITVNKPVETSFAVFTNPFKLSDWVTGLKGIGWISGAQHGVGSKWKFLVTKFGRDYELIQTMKVYKENELFVSNSDNELFSDDVEVKFISKGTSTEIIATSHFSGKNIFWRSVFVFARPFLQKDDQAMYDKLKEVTEKSN